jgi:hypothetical protein
VRTGASILGIMWLTTGGDAPKPMTRHGASPAEGVGVPSDRDGSFLRKNQRAGFRIQLCVFASRFNSHQCIQTEPNTVKQT